MATRYLLDDMTLRSIIGFLRKISATKLYGSLWWMVGFGLTANAL